MHITQFIACYAQQISCAYTNICAYVYINLCKNSVLDMRIQRSTQDREGRTKKKKLRKHKIYILRLSTLFSGGGTNFFWQKDARVWATQPKIGLGRNRVGKSR